MLQSKSSGASRRRSQSFGGSQQPSDLERAKEASLARDLPAVLLASYVANRAVAEKVAATVAAIQLKRLKARCRTAGGAAVKERTRQLPGLPWRLRGAKRRRPQAANPAAAVGAVAAADLVQVKPGGWPAAEVVRAAVLEDGSTVPGVHDLRPVGPWPPAGTCQARSGRLPGMWACSRCPKQASDSSRAGELAKKPCEQAEWQNTAAIHVIVEAAGAWSCQRCKLEVRPQHAASAARATCPVPRLLRGVQPWPEGEASARAVLGRAKGFRRWCCGDESAAAAAAAPDPPAARQPAEAAEQLEHRELACVVCLLVQCVCTGAGAEQAAKRARAAPVEEAGSSGPSLAAYRTHEAVILEPSAASAVSSGRPGTTGHGRGEGALGSSPLRPCPAVCLASSCVLAPLSPERQGLQRHGSPSCWPVPGRGQGRRPAIGPRPCGRSG